MTQPTVFTETKQRNLRPFQPGQSGNPAGRPKGARSRVTESFLRALEEDFTEHGAAAIAAARQSDPVAYIRIVASLVPKGFEISGEVAVKRKLEDMSDDELMAIISGVGLTVAAEVEHED
ncbi:hypothetical protein ACELLULO517_27320 [Acidisoma cellulosilytica]|uniref:DUF5681 domain-containing protein n=1 Tax=Acidisoma cellulosilyticum TaxID=2802395 RepID=A0A964E6P5_9PROT|nr:DUF5681 domain-containing protein [Acidisoma cellulosilyticum]MCB8883980.1 hypothetical protein [Acidisoma cellulosilyticum]